MQDGVAMVASESSVYRRKQAVAVALRKSASRVGSAVQRQLPTILRKTSALRSFNLQSWLGDSLPSSSVAADETQAREAQKSQAGRFWDD